MPRIADAERLVIGGVDTHADRHVAAVVNQVGRVLGTEQFPATAAGYAAALGWMRSHGELSRSVWRGPAAGLSFARGREDHPCRGQAPGDRSGAVGELVHQPRRAGRTKH